MVEVIVDVYVDRDKHVIDEEEHQLLVKMHPNLPEGYGCLLGGKFSKHHYCPSVHINPHSKPIAIR